MSFLPKEAISLTGGCYCKAIRYTVKIPACKDRPAVPKALETPISASEKVETRMPMITIDHCNTCRSQAGCLVQSWVLAPVSWVSWEVLSKDDTVNESLQLSTIEAVGPATSEHLAGTTFVSKFNCTERATRSFCSRCGTNLAYVSHKYLGTPMAFVDITVGSLDPESLEMAKPDRHNWWDFGVRWIQDFVTKGDGGFLSRHQTGDVSKVVPR
jgi:hypothetical protein